MMIFLSDFTPCASGKSRLSSNSGHKALIDSDTPFRTLEFIMANSGSPFISNELQILRRLLSEKNSFTCPSPVKLKSLIICIVFDS